jgi:histidinol-phosphatase (PHP family)
MLDYHTHLLRHGEDGPYRAEHVRAYAVEAWRRGVEEIAITEHLFRFRQADALLRGWWDDDPSEALRAQTMRYWDEHATGDLDEYVTAVTAAADDPGDEPAARIRLGLEVDYYPDRMDAVAAVLGDRPYDVLLGSVHWIGAWGFDQFGDPDVDREWAARPAERIWDHYVDAVVEMAASGCCDVLAHPDLVKVGGLHPPGDPSRWYERLAAAAAGHGLSAEVNSAGWRKPVGEAYPAPSLLAAFRAAGVGVTTASDAHQLADVADYGDGLRGLLAGAGYDTLTGFVQRRCVPRPVTPERQE